MGLTGGRIEFLQDGMEAFRMSGDEDDIGAEGGKFQGDGFADSLATAPDQGVFPIQSDMHV